MTAPLRPWTLQPGTDGWTMKAECPRCLRALVVAAHHAVVECGCGARLTLALGHALHGAFRTRL